MRYRDEKFYWTYQHGVGWPNDYIGPDSTATVGYNNKILVSDGKFSLEKMKRLILWRHLQ